MNCSLPKRGAKFKTDPAPKGKKQCTKCRKIQPVTAFTRQAKAYDGLLPSCRACQAEKDRRRRGASKASSWLRLYGITEHAYWELFEAQGGVCAICKQSETRLHKGCPMHLSVDHDHATGRIRGLLCHGCNAALGRFKDNSTLLENALVYLRGS